MDENLIKEILKEYTDGKSSRELAQKYGCSNQTILNRLHEYCDKNNINIDFHKSPLASTRLNISPEDVYDLYIDGLTPSSIADIYNCSSVTILSRLREYTDKMGIELVLDSHRVKLPDEEIYKKYESGRSICSLAREYYCSTVTIANRLHSYCDENGIELKKHDYSQRRKTISKRKAISEYEIYKKYDSGKSLDDLSIEYSCSKQTILNRLHSYCDKNKIKLNIVKGNTSKLPMNEIYEKYRSGISSYELAREYDVIPRTIISRLKKFAIENGFELKTGKGRNIKNNDLERENQLIFLRQLREILLECLKENDCNDKVINVYKKIK